MNWTDLLKSISVKSLVDYAAPFAAQAAAQALRKIADDIEANPGKLAALILPPADPQ